MRVTIRLLAALWLAELLIIGAFTFVQIKEERARIHDDLERRASLLAEGLKEAVEPSVRRGSPAATERVLRKFARPDRRIAVYDAFAGPIATAAVAAAATRAGPRAPATAAATSVGATPPEVAEAITSGGVRKGLRTTQGRTAYVYATALPGPDRPLGAVAVELDASHLDAAEWAVWRDNGVRFLVLALGLGVITLLVVQVTISKPMTELAEWAKQLRAGRPARLPASADASLFGPIALEVSGLARNLYRARAAAEQEAALRLRGEAIWTEERLKQVAQLELGGQPLFVVSNREPLSHVWRGGKILPVTPASGVVTALDPVMRACGGVWVGHGSGDADRETADERGRLELPPEDPRYVLRRVWLTEREEAGHYYGFANEGLWPLCHVVHARPLFRPSDWAAYRDVNAKFAEALLEEMEGSEAPMVLIQDYHFALLPGLIKAERPDARVAIFWHIPWANFEAFGICPWHEEILHGMLGADLIGFHTQSHCNNFLETVERALEARIDWEHFTVVRGRRVTAVKPFPISVAPTFVEDPPTTSRAGLLTRLGVSAEFLGVGVERLDYTKGLPERFLALQRFFELHPEYRGRLVFVQLGAPSRSRIPRYQELAAQVESTVEAVNRAVGTRGWRPILYLPSHHDRHEIWPFYRHADFCMVTSLHDGMNLVAKEYVSVRDDGDGALILSRFTGAARELRDALLVNPYDVDGTARAILDAVQMPVEERRARMRRMHLHVREHNVYRWAGLLLGELARIPVEPAGRRPVTDPASVLA